MEPTACYARGGSFAGFLRHEDRFDYRKVKANPIASKMGATTVTIVLDPDVAAVFKTSESVNALLRSAISALPTDSRS
jgi:hypothetical protein